MNAELWFTYFRDADLREANLRFANLAYANLEGADLTDADLIRAILTQSKLRGATLRRMKIYGISVWDVELDKTTIQEDLSIAPPKVSEDHESEIRVDSLELAQFINLLLQNKNLRKIIDTLTTKSVLILGRFTTERKAVLDAIREELRKHDYIPILFDFEKPDNRDLTETVMTLASLSRFVIADLSDPHSIPHELMSFADRLLSVPVQGIFCPVKEHPNLYPMYEHLRRLPHVLPIYHYETAEELIASLEEKVIKPAEEKVKEVRPGTLS